MQFPFFEQISFIKPPQNFFTQACHIPQKRFHFHIWATNIHTILAKTLADASVTNCNYWESPEAPACQSQSRYQCQFQTYKCTTSHDPLLCTGLISVVLRYPVIGYCIPHVHFRPWQQECPIMAWISDKLWDREDKARQCVLYPDSYTSPQVGSFQFHICFSTSLKSQGICWVHRSRIQWQFAAIGDNQ